MDVNRTDVYDVDGTPDRPFKVLTDAVTLANLLASAIDPYRINVAPGIYDLPSFAISSVDDEYWDDGSGTLAAVTGGKYTNATLYITVNSGGEEYHVVYGQEEFASAVAAQEGALPVPPNVLKEYCCRSAAIIVLKSAGAIDSLVDTRPQVGQYATMGGGVAGDHDLLLNLDHDTHLQYHTAARALAAHGTYTGAHVTSGDAHANTGGAGAQVDHANLANIGTRTHVQLEADIALKLDASQKAAAGGVASLDVGSKVVQDPANATATPTAGKIPIADGSGKLDGWVTANVYGTERSYAEVLARSTYNTTTNYQTKVTLTTGALVLGATYRVRWRAVLDSSATNQNVGAQLTDGGALLGTEIVWRAGNAAERTPICGEEYVTGTGAARTFAIQHKTYNAGTTVGAQNAKVEVIRVA